MDINFLLSDVNLVIVGICFCVGYVIKTAFSKLDNKYIPLIVCILGTGLAILSDFRHINLNLILTGMVSGLASTGSYEMIRSMFSKNKNESEENLN